MLLPYDSHTLYGSVVHHKLLWVIVLIQLWQDVSLAMPTCIQRISAVWSPSSKRETLPQWLMVGTGSAAALEIAREVVRPAGHWICSAMQDLVACSQLCSRTTSSALRTENITDFRHLLERSIPECSRDEHGSLLTQLIGTSPSIPEQ